jgi:hypothetical protein
LVDSRELIIPNPVPTDMITAKNKEFVISQNTVTWNNEVIENINIDNTKKKLVMLK